MSLVLLARGKAEGRNGGAERSENSMAGVIESGPRAEAENSFQSRLRSPFRIRNTFNRRPAD